MCKVETHFPIERTSRIFKENKSSQRFPKVFKNHDNTMRVECYIGETLNVKEIRL